MNPPLFLARRRLLRGVAAAAATVLLSTPAFAADPLKIGLILPLTGPFASTGKQIEAACRLYIAKNGDTVAGRKVELIVKDDTGLAPETTKRIAQELIVQDKVSVLAGFGLTPLALAAAPVATEAKVPMVVMAAATGDHPDPLAVHRARQLHAAAGHGADGRVGAEEQDQARRHDGHRLWPRARRREDVHAGLQGGRRRDRRVDQDAAAQSRLRAVPAAREGREARRAVRVRALRRGPRGDEAVRRARPEAGRHPPDRHRRRHRRRPAGEHGRAGGRHHHVVPLLGRARFAREQGLRRRLHEGEQRDAAELPLGRRLRRHAPDLRGGEEGGTDGQRRAAGRGDEGHEVDEPARTDVDRSGDAPDDPERLHARSEDGQRQALERRVRQVRERQGPG